MVKQVTEAAPGLGLELRYVEVALPSIEQPRRRSTPPSLLACADEVVA